jgi:hypothetical protein
MTLQMHVCGVHKYVTIPFFSNFILFFIFIFFFTFSVFQASSTGTVSPIWAASGSHITIKTGVLRITSPLASWGTIYITQGAALVLDGDTATTSLAIFGEADAPRIVCEGMLAVNKGQIRIIGTSIVGSGSMLVAREAGLELDPRYDTILGDVNTSTERKVTSKHTKKDFFYL